MTRRVPTTTAEFRAAAPARMKEDALLRHVLKTARTLNWLSAHFRPAMKADGTWRTAVQGDGKGFPDLVLVHQARGEIIYAELKSSAGEVTVEQATWLLALRAAGQRAYVWTPADWYSGVIERELGGEA